MRNASKPFCPILKLANVSVFLLFMPTLFLLCFLLAWVTKLWFPIYLNCEEIMLYSKTAKLGSDVVLWVETERKAVWAAEESLRLSLSG